MKPKDWYLRVMVTLLVVGVWVLILKPVLAPTPSHAAEAKQPVPEVVRAQRFDAVDSGGKLWASLSAPSEPDTQPGLIIFGKGGQECARLALNGLEHPQLALRNRDCKGSAGLGISEQGAATLTLWSWHERGMSRIGLGPIPDGTVGLSLSDRRGRERAVLELADDGTPRLSLFDGRGEGQPGSWTRARVKPRVIIALASEGSPVLALFDKDGKVLWKAP